VTVRVAREAIAEVAERPSGTWTSRRAIAGSIAAGLAILVMAVAVGSRPSSEAPPLASSPANVPEATEVVHAEAVAPAPPPPPAALVVAAAPEPAPATPSPVAEPVADSPPPAAKSREPVAVAAVASAEAPRAKVKPAPRREPLTVTVKDGTTLFGLVRSIYGPGVRFDRVYDEIRRLNPGLKDPSHIRAGTTLRLPPKDHEYVLR
jgi:nucleoid-associated protein YgaU